MAAKKPEPVPQTPMLRRPVKPVTAGRRYSGAFPCPEKRGPYRYRDQKPSTSRARNSGSCAVSGMVRFTDAELTLQQGGLEAPVFSEVKSILIQEYAR